VVSVTELNIPNAARQAYQDGVAALKDDPTKSAQYFQKAIELYPEFAQAYAMLGLAYMQQKKSPEASAALAKAISLNPKLSMAHTLMGKLWLEQRDFSRAEADLLESIRLDPQAWDSSIELARCYFNMAKLDKALEYARRANAAPQDPSGTHLLLVDIYLRRGDRQNALAELEKFAQSDARSPLMPRVQQKINELRRAN
jgi:tetratricopeptide (TPR) repeat protein